MYSLEVYPVSEGHSRFSSMVMPQEVSKGMIPYCRQYWNPVLHSGISIFLIIMPGCWRRSRKINSNSTLVVVVCPWSVVGVFWLSSKKRDVLSIFCEEAMFWPSSVEKLHSWEFTGNAGTGMGTQEIYLN